MADESGWMIARYLEEENEERAELLLDQIVRQARPTIYSVLRRLVKSPEEWGSEVECELVQELRRRRSLGDRREIYNFRNFLIEFSRRVVSNKSQYKSIYNKVYYLLKNSCHFKLWLEGNNLVGGLRSWHSRQVQITEGYIHWLTDPHKVVRTLPFSWQSCDDSSGTLQAILIHLFNYVKSPIFISDIVNGLIQLNIGEIVLIDLDIYADNDEEDGDAPVDSFPSNDPSPLESVRTREIIQVLWREITTLSREHRAIILLSIPPYVWFEFISADACSSIEDIAQVIGINVDTLQDWFWQLPLPDAEIARWLRLPNEQAVRNRRSKARQRLQRRLGKIL